MLLPRARTVLQSVAMLVYAVVDDALSPNFPLGDAVDVFIRREHAERLVEEVRSHDPELAEKLRIEERKLSGKSSPRTNDPSSPSRQRVRHRQLH